MQNVDGECTYIPTNFMITIGVHSWDRMIKSSKKFRESWLANIPEIHHKCRLEYQNKDKKWSRQE